MRLHPNPPRLVTVGLAVALAVVGFIDAWPVDPLVSVLGVEEGFRRLEEVPARPASAGS